LHFLLQVLQLVLLEQLAQPSKNPPFIGLSVVWYANKARSIAKTPGGIASFSGHKKKPEPQGIPACEFILPELR
jgi:hypothetical protein